MDTWMGDNYDALADRRLDQLTLPGTHDSAAFALAPPSASGPLSPSLRDRALYLLARLAGPCVAPWTLTQHCCVRQQLSRLGARFLDIRVAWSVSQRGFVTSHTFACAPLAEVLGQVVAFLTGAGHEREVVVLCLRPDWPHRAGLAAPGCAAALLRVVVAVCGGLLYPRAQELPTLREMEASGRRLLVFVEGVPEPEPGTGAPLGAELTPGVARKAPQEGLVGSAAALGGVGRLALYLNAFASGQSVLGRADFEGRSSVATAPGAQRSSREGKGNGGGCGQDNGEDSYVWLAAGCQAIWADSDTPARTVEGLLRMIAQMRGDGRLPAPVDAGGGCLYTGQGAAVPGSSQARCFAACNSAAGVARRKGDAGAGDPSPRATLFWYVSAAVTPSAGSIVRSVLADPRTAGLRRLAAQLEAEQLPALLEEGLAGVGAVCLDHPSPAALRAVVQLNLVREQTSGGS